MDSSSLAQWLKPHCAIQEGGEQPLYVRVRAGRARKNADSVYRRDLAGEDPAVLTREILDRHSRLTKGERAWVEIMRKPGRETIDVLPLGSAPDVEDGGDDGGASLGDLENASPTAMVGIVIQALVATNGQLSSQLVHKDDKYHELLLKHVESSALAAAKSATLDWIEEHGTGEGDSEYAEAVAALIPYVGPALAAMLARSSSKGGGKAPGIEETNPQKADRAIGLLEEVWRDEPVCLLEDQARLVRLGMLAEAIRQRVGGAVRETST